jgi:hypothetical protein
MAIILEIKPGLEIHLVVSHCLDMATAESELPPKSFFAADGDN